MLYFSLALLAPDNRGFNVPCLAAPPPPLESYVLRAALMELIFCEAEVDETGGLFLRIPSKPFDAFDMEAA